MDDDAISFGSYRLLASQRLLLEGDSPVRLGGRAFDVLAALIERAGEVVPKEELITRAWPTTVVEEGNLKLQIGALRRALGDSGVGRFIVTVPGRGYSFVAPVSRETEPRSAPSPMVAASRLHNLPFAVTKIIGREDTVTTLVSRLAGNRLVTIVGPGGIGKTTVALAVAEAVASAYEHGVWLVDLAPLAEPHLVVSTMATVLGLEIAADPLPGLVASLAGKRMLLVIDNCEHLIEAASTVAAMLLRGAPDIYLLATSREPLGVDGEREYRLGPLAMPSPSSPRMTAAEALAFPAVQLFAERVSAVIDVFALSDSDAPLAVEICRKLDGLPLAIEFAAARVDVLGIHGLVASLDDSLRFLGGRRRGAMPRQRTVRAVLDWSHGLLREDEKRFFRRLGIFSGDFSIEAAASVATDAGQPPGSAFDLLADLVGKSLLAAEIGGAEPRFRLLETTRLYALQKLGESGEREQIARRHAEFYRDRFERAEAEWETRRTAEWQDDYGWKIGNLRAALDWTFSPGGDASVGVALAAAAVPLFMHLSLVEECGVRAAQAVAALATVGDRDARREMKLQAALATSLMSGRGAAHQISAAWTTVRRIAEDLQAAEYQLRSLRGLWSFHDARGECRIAMGLARRFRKLAVSRGDCANRLVGDRLIGMSQLRLGYLSGARRRLEHFLANYAIADRRDHFQSDQKVSTRAFLARILWLQGYPDKAMQAAKGSVEEARETNHTYSLCFALAHAGWIALIAGDLVAAEPLIENLVDLSARGALTHWHAWGRGHQGELAIKRGDVAAGLSLLRAGLDELGVARSGLRYGMFLPRIAAALAQTELVSDGYAAIEDALAWTERGEERWTIADLLRIKGDLVLLGATEGGACGAEDHFRQALDWAGRQGALSWELRAATSLARLLRDQGRYPDALAILQPVYGRFTEGFGTADLIAAKRLLDEMSDVRRE